MITLSLAATEVRLGIIGTTYKASMLNDAAPARRGVGWSSFVGLGQDFWLKTPVKLETTIGYIVREGSLVP
jgi:hypothetical protein